jgi:hypothetical protein
VASVEVRERVKHPRSLVEVTCQQGARAAPEQRVDPDRGAAGLVKKWGAARVDQACRRALDAEAVDVNA